MGKKKGFNSYEVRGEMTIIFLENKQGDNFDALIDTEDLERIKDLGLHWYPKWEDHINGYYVGATEYLGCIDGKPKYKSHYLHREIMNANEGRRNVPDHINHNTLDNRKSNLRLSLTNKNLKHRKGKNSNNKTGYRNVSWINSRQKYVVQLQINGISTLLGEFDDVHEAGKFAEEMRNKYYKEYAGAS